MSIVGLSILVLVVIFLFIKLEIKKWLDEWFMVYAILIMMWFSENWIWLLCSIAWIVLCLVVLKAGFHA